MGAEATTTAIWSLTPESSQPWQGDPYFGASGQNATDPLHGEAIDFIGYKHPGGSQEMVGSAHLVARYRVDFSEPVDVLALSITGFGDFSGASVMRILNAQKVPLVTQSLNGNNLNSVNTITVKAGLARGSTFFVDLADSSWDGTYISNIVMTTNSLTLQCTR